MYTTSSRTPPFAALLTQAFIHAEHRRLELPDHHLPKQLSGGVH
ncbi:hypothetical protein [Deinococcus humi]|uniref:Uncharacterized protein n=1 Tax=Deinococcus humi TaxID=662880 RepID=A0A7W8K068_9DEIO|nr:hypothetical protein [Deinococcus humi]MBB5366394.1 hypothetical protein [Deinococcus humi]